MTEEKRGEGWARERLAQSEPLVFPEEWPEADRTLSGGFAVEAMLDSRWSKVSEGFLLSNAVISTPLERRYALIAWEISFEECLFQGPVDLTYTDFGRRVRFRGCAFSDALDMEASHVSELWFCDSTKGTPTIFRSGANFFSMKMTGRLVCERAQFLSELQEAYFNSVQISHHASLKESIFHGPVNFVGAGIGGQMICERAEFRSPEGLAYFNGAKIAHHATFRGAVFHGPVDFGIVYIGNQLLCEQTQFLNATKMASFSGAKIKGGAFFRETLFQGPANLIGASIGTGLYCEGARFLTGESVNFDNMQVEGPASFQGALFQCPVYLSHCIFSQNLLLKAAQFKGLLSLYNTTVAGTLYVFSPSEIEGGASSLTTQLPAAADLRGLTYDRTDLGNEDRWQGWIALRRDGDDYDPGPYLALEQSFRRAGRDDLGDRVHFEMRRAEGRFLRRRRHIGKFVLHSLWRWSVGYGVGGQRLFYLISGVFFSTYLLVRYARQHDLFKPGKEPDPNPFSPFWYTLDLLLPGVSLDYQDHWQTTDGVFYFFSRGVILVGWILVPLAVAQLAGLLKKKE